MPTPQCHCKIENGYIVFCSLHAAATGLYAAVEYVRKILPTFTPAEEKDRNMLEQIILPYLDRQLKAAETRQEIGFSLATSAQRAKLQTR